MWPEPRPTSIPSGILIHPAIWPQHTWAKNGGCALLRGELGPHLTQCGWGQGLRPCQVSSWYIQPFGHNTPMSQTGQTDKGLIAKGEPFYKRSPKNGWTDRDVVWVVDSGWPKEACIRWDAYWRNLANTTELSICGGLRCDHFLKLLWPLVFLLCCKLYPNSKYYTI